MKKSVARRLAGLSEEEIAKRRQEIADAEAYHKRLKQALATLPPDATQFDVDVVKRLVSDAKNRVHDLKKRKARPAAIAQ